MLHCSCLQPLWTSLHLRPMRGPGRARGRQGWCRGAGLPSQSALVTTEESPAEREFLGEGGEGSQDMRGDWSWQLLHTLQSPLCRPRPRGAGMSHFKAAPSTARPGWAGTRSWRTPGRGRCGWVGIPGPVLPRGCPWASERACTRGHSHQMSNPSPVK